MVEEIIPPNGYKPPQRYCNHKNKKYKQFKKKKTSNPLLKFTHLDNRPPSEYQPPFTTTPQVFNSFYKPPNFTIAKQIQNVYPLPPPPNLHSIVQNTTTPSRLNVTNPNYSNLEIPNSPENFPASGNSLKKNSVETLSTKPQHTLKVGVSPIFSIKLETPEDIDAWIKERKKKHPCVTKSLSPQLNLTAPSQTATDVNNVPNKKTKKKTFKVASRLRNPQNKVTTLKSSPNSHILSKLLLLDSECQLNRIIQCLAFLIDDKLLTQKK